MDIVIIINFELSKKIIFISKKKNLKISKTKQDLPIFWNDSIITDIKLIFTKSFQLSFLIIRFSFQSISLLFSLKNGFILFFEIDLFYFWLIKNDFIKPPNKRTPSILNWSLKFFFFGD